MSPAVIRLPGIPRRGSIGRRTRGCGRAGHGARREPGAATATRALRRLSYRVLPVAAGVPGPQPRIERVSVFSFAAPDRLPLPRPARLPGRRRRPPDDPARRDRHEHRHPRPLRIGLEARMGAGRLGRTRPAGLLRGRAPTGWLHNVARSADPAGARRQADQALPWDLNGRLAQHRLRHANQTVSTLDLLSDGLTLTGPGEPSRRQAAASRNTPAPSDHPRPRMYPLRAASESSPAAP